MPVAPSSEAARSLPWAVLWCVAAWGLVLNAVWEFAQAGTLYDMWSEVGLGKGLFHITLAILGDGVIVLGVAGAAALCMGRTAAPAAPFAPNFPNTPCLRSRPLSQRT